MGALIKGQWQDSWYDTSHTGGAFKRESAQFRQAITQETDSLFPAEKGRYHLYVSLACPWAHRSLIFRTLKKLESYIGLSVVHPHMLENGWEFKTGMDGTTGDTLYGLRYLYELYCKADSQYSGRVTVPVLWDKKKETIVSNESAEIIRQLNGAFNHLTGNHQDFYPPALAKEIDTMNDKIYATVNNGVYKCGFATTQEAYEHAFYELFATLDELDRHLSQNEYLVGGQLTEADWRLFTTLIRFDAVYFGHFKTNQQRISDYRYLQPYLKKLYQHPGIKQTVNFEHIKQHYYYSHKTINPTQIVPVGPRLDFQ
ncbi:glutathione S-transferase family protein [Legionella maioricensis]|uniref:Glutathione S-transferase family protein n=1 Tax=Legionella maioricensis TaxID=2896528 RepID=A0A9X2CZV1_9GAMM|nr:glutathione S-transferase family protein [Legionella maioricensis]MCL9683846.1 glutathione S-transferase family protein [Legionella maioricensis]MCL9686693.1 glutathione S-transferase family protein [Legionella maioricensis]